MIYIVSWMEFPGGPILNAAFKKESAARRCYNDKKMKKFEKVTLSLCALYNDYVEGKAI